METGKLQFSKIITHLNWSRSLINVVPIQTESCLNTTTFVDIENHVSTDFLCNWLNEYSGLLSYHVFFKPVDGICGFARSDDSCHHIVNVVILCGSD